MKNREKYLQVADYIENFISDKMLSPGDKTPSVRTLMKELGTTRATVSRGMQLLADRGIIVSNIGSGSFVADRRKIGGGAPSVGLLLHTRSDAYAMNIIDAVYHAAKLKNVELRVSAADGYREQALKAAEELLKSGCGALLIPWCNYREISDLASFMRRTPLPTCIPVSIPGFEEYGMGAPELAGIGETQGVMDLCEYFRLLGEKRLVLLGPNDSGNRSMYVQITGFSEFVSRNNMAHMIRLADPTVPGMDKIAAELAGFRGELAVICYDDIHAQRFMTAMHKSGLAAPSDFRIIGRNDTSTAIYCDPPLSSVRPDYGKLGEIALRSVTAMAAGERWQSKSKIPEILVVRESCGGMNSADEKLTAKMKLLNVVLPLQRDPFAEEVC